MTARAFSPFANGADIDGLLPGDTAAVMEHAAREGAVIFRGFNIKDAQGFDGVVRKFNLEPFTYERSLSNAVRINRTDLVFTANEAPADVEIFLHHELAQTPISPRWLFFFCASAAESGGATPLCRSDRVFEDLCREQPAWATMLEEHGLKYTTIMPAGTDGSSGQGRSWHQTLGADSREDAEARLTALGYSWEWQSDESIAATSPPVPAVMPLADGSKSLFTQMIAVWRGWKNGQSAMLFGDGQPLPAELPRRVCELAEKHTVDAEWQDFDFAIVDNWRVMHGRRPFAGQRQREVLVAMAA